MIKVKLKFNRRWQSDRYSRAKLVGFSNVMLISFEFHLHTLQARKYGPADAGVVDGVASCAATTDSVFWQIGHWKQFLAHLIHTII